jgi:hypothetical protein
MRKPSRSVEPTSSHPPAPPVKKPYRAPRLVEYGDLRKITLAKGGNMNDDPTPPATRK